MLILDDVWLHNNVHPVINVLVQVGHKVNTKSG